MHVLSPIYHINNSLIKLLLEISIPNKRIRRIVKGDIAKKYLKKYVKKVVQRNANNNAHTQEIQNYTIWQFWDKGIENAPEIVKRCVESIDKHEPDKNHVVLNMENIKDYVDIPQKYYDMVNSGKMGMAHFSDLLRTYLLIQYGGCWIDSTVLLTGKLPSYIVNSDLFLFQNYQNADLDGLNIANYFIHSKPNHKLLLDQRDVLEEYWNDNDFAENYFFYLHFFTMLTSASEQNSELWKKVPFISFLPVQHLQKEILNQFDEFKWNCFKSSSSIHKLSFKTQVLGLDHKDSTGGTYYDKLINGELL